LLSGELVAGRYRIDELVGLGGMGAVYRAEHVATGRRVALKWMLPKADGGTSRRRFLREAKALGRIEHRNVVSVLDFGEHGDGAYLVMEFLEGHSLRLLCAHGPVPIDEALHALLPALRGLAAAHDAGVVHRDLKPSNIFLCCDSAGVRRETKVLDFGISKVSAQGEEIDVEESLTRTGTAIGTPAYMAPEQLMERTAVDARTDIHALGVILYELLAGRRPYDAQSYEALVVQIVTQTCTPLGAAAAELPKDLARVVDRALSKEPEERYQTVEQFAEALRPWAPSGAHFDSAFSSPSTHLVQKGMLTPSTLTSMPSEPDVAAHETSGERPVTTPSATGAQTKRRPLLWLAGAAVISTATYAAFALPQSADPPAQRERHVGEDPEEPATVVLVDENAQADGLEEALAPEVHAIETTRAAGLAEPMPNEPTQDRGPPRRTDSLRAAHAVEAPAVEAPAVEAPAAEAPPVKTPSDETPPDETPNPEVSAAPADPSPVRGRTGGLGWDDF